MYRFVRQFVLVATVLATVIATSFGPISAMASFNSVADQTSVAAAHQHDGEHHDDAAAVPASACQADGSDCAPVGHDHSSNKSDCCAMACHSFVEGSPLPGFVPEAAANALSPREPTTAQGSSTAPLDRPPNSSAHFG